MQMWSQKVRDGWETKHTRPKEYREEVLKARRHRLLISGTFVMKDPNQG